MSEPLSLSVVIPVFNEEETLPELIRRCLAACEKTGCAFELILVDDGSADRSAALIDETVRMDRRDSLFRRLASRMVNKAVQKTTGVMMHDYGCMLRAYRRHIVQAMLQCPERSTFIPVLANSFARRTAEIEVRHEKRATGESKYSVLKLINLQFDLLTSMTTFPLRLLSIFGAVTSAAGVGFGILLLVLRFVFGSEWAAHGVFTLFAILFIFVGAQFIGMGLLGEYIGRLYYDVRARPRYFVDRVVGESRLGR